MAKEYLGFRDHQYSRKNLHCLLILINCVEKLYAIEVTPLEIAQSDAVHIRTTCCVCLSGEIFETESIANVPVYMGVSKEEKSKDIEFDQIWGICQNCSCVQLTRLLPRHLLYKYNHHQEVVGETWLNHHREFSKFVLQSEPKDILEIGGAHGYLAKLIVQENPNIEFTMVEPDTSLISDKIKLVNGFIEDNLDQLRNKDTIVHSHVLEHVYNPIYFLFKVANFMELGGNMIFSIPNMPKLIELGGMNALNFEHTYLLVVEQLEVIVQILGFECEEKKHYGSHSIFFRLKKNKLVDESVLPKIKETVPDVREESLKFFDSISQTKKFVDRINDLIALSQDDIYIFGAHVFSQALFSLGLNEERISGVIDNARTKQHLRLYGTNLSVISPEEALSGSKNPVVIVRASHYQSEIVEQLKKLNNFVTVLQ